MLAIKHLEALPEVKKVELISRVDKPLVIVSLARPVDIKHELESLPCIQNIEASNDLEQDRPTFAVKTQSLDKVGF